MTQTTTTLRVPATPADPAADTTVQSGVEAGVAANDDSHPARLEKPENPLWVINIAMAAFFVTAALVMMIS